MDSAGHFGSRKVLTSGPGDGFKKRYAFLINTGTGTRFENLSFVAPLFFLDVPIGFLIFWRRPDRKIFSAAAVPPPKFFEKSGEPRPRRPPPRY